MRSLDKCQHRRLSEIYYYDNLPRLTGETISKYYTAFCNICEEMVFCQTGKISIPWTTNRNLAFGDQKLKEGTMGVLDALKKGGSSILDVIAPPVNTKPIPQSAEVNTEVSKVVVASSMNQAIYDEVTQNLLQRGKVFNDFKTKLKSVEDVIPDTSQRYKAMAKSMAVGKDVLISALNEQRTGISSELKKFEDDMLELTDSEAKTKEEIDSYDKGIKSLQDQITQLQANRNEVEGKLTGQSALIKQLRDQFGSTIKFIESEFDEMERNLNLYIK